MPVIAPSISIQHHHAHVVSLLAEHEMLGEPIIGVAFDGTGYGCDDTVWGGEILRLGPDSHRFTRVGHLAEVPLAGGDAAVRNPWRMALAHLWHARVAVECRHGSRPGRRTRPNCACCARNSQRAAAVLHTTSMGRLFDAVASLLDVRQQITYEGQAAIELEVLAATEFYEPAAPGPELRVDVDPDGILDPTRMLATMVSALRDGAEPAHLAAAFHHAVAVAVTDVVGQVAGHTRTVGLTGGVFQNVLLLKACRQRWKRRVSPC